MKKQSSCCIVCCIIRVAVVLGAATVRIILGNSSITYTNTTNINTSCTNTIITTTVPAPTPLAAAQTRAVHLSITSDCHLNKQALLYIELEWIFITRSMANGTCVSVVTCVNTILWLDNLMPLYHSTCRSYMTLHIYRGWTK